MKDLELTVRVRNNRLKERRIELGLSQPELASKARVSVNVYRNLEALRIQPRDRIGSWSRTALALSAFHGVDVEELFPPVTMSVANPVVTRRISGEDLLELATAWTPNLLEGPDSSVERAERLEMVEGAMGVLAQREVDVLKMRFAEDMTLRQVGKRIGTCANRARQIEARAIRKLRHACKER